MLPLIPALILLLLQGPSNVEKLAHEGRLPAALHAVHQSLANTDRHSPEREALAQLIAASGDVSLSRALAQLLALAGDEPEAAVRVPILSESSNSGPVASLQSTDDASEGFLRSQRTRDGPIAGSGL